MVILSVSGNSQLLQRTMGTVQSNYAYDKVKNTEARCMLSDSPVYTGGHFITCML